MEINDMTLLSRYRAVFCCLLTCLVLVNFPAFSWALSATTAQTIQGNMPYILGEGGTVPSDINHVINFSVPIGGTDTIFYGSSTLPQHFDPTLKFSNFDVDFRDDQYADDDIDPQKPIKPITADFIIEWKDKYGQVITDLSKNLDSCYSPYQLAVTANNIKVNSEYGDPYENNTIGPLTHTFKNIYVDDYQKLCSIRPYSVDWLKTDASTQWWPKFEGSGNRDSAYGGGYNNSQFTHLLGFNTTVGFPTTGFPQAWFSIVVPEPQTAYSISASNSSIEYAQAGDSLPGISNGLSDYYQIAGTTPNQIRLIEKVITPITINITHIPSGWTTNYTFTINMWAGTFGDSSNKDYAVNFCNLYHNGLLTRVEYTNAPLTIAGQYNAATRQIGYFASEWGNMASYNGSGIGWGYYWTNDPKDSNQQYVVNPANGSIWYGDNTSPLPTICKL